MAKISEFFGKDNHTKINRGDRYLCLSLMHYLSTAIAQKISSWGTTTWRIVGVAMDGFRALASLYVMNVMEDYSNPFKRSNKNGHKFIFGDLLRGPKFDK